MSDAAARAAEPIRSVCGCVSNSVATTPTSSFTHHPRTFSPSLVAHHLLGSMGAPSLGRRRSNLAADFGESMRDFPKRARANLFEQLEPTTCHTSAGTPKFVRLINRTPCEFKFWHKRTSFCSFANSALSVWEKQRPRRVMVSRPSFPPNWPFGGRAANTLPDAGGSEAAVGTCRD